MVVSIPRKPSPFFYLLDKIHLTTMKKEHFWTFPSENIYLTKDLFKISDGDVVYFFLQFFLELLLFFNSFVSL